MRVAWPECRHTDGDPKSDASKKTIYKQSSSDIHYGYEKKTIKVGMDEKDKICEYISFYFGNNVFCFGSFYRVGDDCKH